MYIIHGMSGLVGAPELLVGEPEHLGSVIRSLRLAGSLSQREFGERAGLSQPAIARLEAGRQLPTLATLQRVAKALELDLLLRIPRAKPSPVDTA